MSNQGNIEETNPAFSSNSATVTGKGHIRQGTSCQDVALHYSSDDIGIAIVCDGAGSSKYGYEAAVETSKQVKEYFVNRQHSKKNADEIRNELCDILIKSLFQLKEQYDNCIIKDLYSTLVFGVLDKKTDEYIIGHIGDGLIVGFEPTSMRIFSEPENGEMANETFFVAYTVEPKLRNKHFRIKRKPIGNVIGFAIMSDGTADTYHIKNKFLNREGIILNPDLIAYFENLDKFSNDEVEQQLYHSIEKRVTINTDDDCSIALLKLNKPKQPLLITHGELRQNKIIAERRLEDKKVIEARSDDIGKQVGALKHESTQKDKKIESLEKRVRTMETQTSQANRTIKSLEKIVRTLETESNETGIMQKLKSLLGWNRSTNVKNYINTLVKQEIKKNQVRSDSEVKSYINTFVKQEIKKNQEQLDSKVGKKPEMKEKPEQSESLAGKEDQLGEDCVIAPESLNELPRGKYSAENKKDYLEIRDSSVNIFLKSISHYSVRYDEITYKKIDDKMASIKIIYQFDREKKLLSGELKFISDISFQFTGYIYPSYTPKKRLPVDEILTLKK